MTKELFYNKQFLADSWLFTPVLNTGIGWSIPVHMTLVLVLTAIIVLGSLYLRKNKELNFRTTVFLLAGALGNGIDRVVYDGVRDFIDLKVRPVFNVADICLTIAILLLIVYTFRRKKVNN